MFEGKISRRGALQLSALGATAFLLNACQSRDFLHLYDSETLPVGERPDVELSIRAVPDRVQILNGPETGVWRYQGEVISGPANSMTVLPQSYLGPIIRVERGQLIRIHFQNLLPEASIIHWHGLHVPPEDDGHPRLAIQPEQTYTYEFRVMDRAGTYWYHPHPHGRTGPQVYAGLAGLFIITDPEERRYNLPSGEHDLPLVIQDRVFSTDNQLVYNTGQMMSRMVGFLGNRVLVNGMADSTIPVESRSYRLRLLNGSNSRIYKLAWKDGSPLTVIGTDGGLLEKPINRKYLTLAPAQRAEIWVDFSAVEIGAGRELISLPFVGFGGQEEFSVMKFDLVREVDSSSTLADSFSTHIYENPEEASNFRSPRNFRLTVGPGMLWTINGRTFKMDEVANDEIIRLNDLEVWEFENLAGQGMGMMGSMSQPHPIHVHGLQFRVLDREIAPELRESWGSVADGFVDQGWHDTVLVYPGEKVRILVKFTDFPGLYLYHCHNLEHEDMGMMRNYRVDE